MANDEKNQEVDQILDNARNSVQLNMQRSSRLGTALGTMADQFNDQIKAEMNLPGRTRAMLEGGLRHGEMFAFGALNNKLHPAWEGIGAVTDREDALNRLEQLGKNSASNMFYVDKENNRNFQLPALSHGKSELMFNIVIKNPILRDIYAKAVLVGLDLEGSLVDFIDRQVEARKVAKEAKVEALKHPVLTHMRLGNGSDLMMQHYNRPAVVMGVDPAGGESVTALHYRDADMSDCPVFNPVLIERLTVNQPQSNDALLSKKHQTEEYAPTVLIPRPEYDFTKEVPENRADRRAKKPKRHGDKQSVTVVKVRPSGLLKGLMGKVK